MLLESDGQESCGLKKKKEHSQGRGCGRAGSFIGAARRRNCASVEEGEG